MTVKTSQFTAQNTKLFPYTGSKAKYGPHFENLHSQIAIKKVGTYIDAFGGTLSSVFHNLQNISADRIIINDINSRLINLYTQIKENPQEVIEVFTLLEDTFQKHIPTRFKNEKLVRDKALREKRLGHLRDFYKNARDFYNSSDFTTAQNAGTLVFILQHNFNGIYSEAKKNAHFNVSFNWNMKKVAIETITTNIMNLHEFFTQNDVIIENLDTDDLITKYSDDSDTLLYLDPPYINSDIGYSAEQTTDYNTLEAHLKLLESAKVFDYVMYSNNYNETINEQLQYRVDFKRTNGITQNQQHKSKEEVLGFIDNTYIAMPTVEELIHTNELNKLTQIPQVEDLLSVVPANKIAASNNTSSPVSQAA